MDNQRNGLLITTAVFLILTAVPALVSAQTAAADRGDYFFEEYWYEQGATHGNPKFNNRFRVNAPEAVVDPRFKDRVETRGNGMMQILAPRDPTSISQPSLYLEIWGGHPGTAGKRVTINGRSLYPLPQAGTEEEHCTHQYPLISLLRTDLVNGYNALQFACDQGSTFWGHFIVENAALRFQLTNGHPALSQANLAGFRPTVSVLPIAARPEVYLLSLNASASMIDRIASVSYEGYYTGYDENGDGRQTDWHGFTKNRIPMGTLGYTNRAPFQILWDATMLPDQEAFSLRAIVRLRAPANLAYVTPVLRSVELGRAPNTRVTAFAAQEMPSPFWSRAGNPKRCVIPIPIPPARIEQAELKVLIWDGGHGGAKNHFTLNGAGLPVAGPGRHDVLYRTLPINARLLRQGDNEIRLLSTTQHHGLEVLLPGPSVVVRYRP